MKIGNPAEKRNVAAADSAAAPAKAAAEAAKPPVSYTHLTLPTSDLV